ncbi:MAG: hypothetical protein E6R13_04395 [Spirochaetes bacterium]|nr:MAG: hypothetical protein E6R13_04395 [Spirochaetota bacterium]
MNREIKFRVWYKEEKLMYYDFEKLNTYDPESEVLMQYTGLKDINGVEVYEGDIVEYEGWMEYQDYVRQSKKDLDKPHVLEICFKDFSFRVKKIFKKDCFYENLSTIEQKYIKIIGNIHENPELIKG